MDIDLARTFLEIIRGGSFIAAAERMHLTQTAVTARIQNLESQLGCRLFVRNRAGARLTDDGERFVAYANQLVQTWEAARRDLPLPQGYDQLLTLGAEVSLCNPLMLAWVQRLRETLPSHALRSEVASDEELQKKLDLGLLDAALVHQPEYWPGLQVEQLLEEKLIQVVQTRNPEPYLYVDWGPAFRKQHNQALPEHTRAAMSFSLGPLALQYLVQCGGRLFPHAGGAALPRRRRAQARRAGAGILASGVPGLFPCQPLGGAGQGAQPGTRAGAGRLRLVALVLRDLSRLSPEAA